jgi:hypothetical protein
MPFRKRRKEHRPMGKNPTRPTNASYMVDQSGRVIPGSYTTTTEEAAVKEEGNWFADFKRTLASIIFLAFAVWVGVPIILAQAV